MHGCRYWECYTKVVAFSVIISFAVECLTVPSMDTFALLDAQTQDVATRFTRSKLFYTEAFKALKVKPAAVERPGSKGKKMLGVLAEIPLRKGELVVRGKGSWWHPAFALPSAAERNLNNMAAHWPTCWGVKMQTMAPLIFVMNASNPMSIVNDYRKITATSNCSLVQEFFKGDDGKLQPTLQVSIQADKDIEAGEQVLVDYGASFCLNNQHMEDEDTEQVYYVMFTQSRFNTNQHKALQFLCCTGGGSGCRRANHAGLVQAQLPERAC